jgi:hypothetical protein
VLHTGPDKKVQRFNVSEEVIGIVIYESQLIIDEIVKTTKKREQIHSFCRRRSPEIIKPIPHLGPRT